MKRLPCPHCGRSCGQNGLQRHVVACPANPAVREAVLCAMTDPAAPGFAVEAGEYDARARRTGAPSISVLRHQVGGGWVEICAAFGLQPAGAVTIGRGECPHCGRAVAQLKKHVKSCPYSPPVRARIIQALEDPNRPGYAVGGYLYETSHGMPSRETLKRHIAPDWASICIHFGLLPPGQSRAKQHSGEQQLLDELEAEREEARRALEYERDRGGALEVCRVREIDGGRRVAYMLR